jgi:hypothetical protein
MTAIGHGTVFLDRAGIDLDADVEARGHRISKFSPFHAALLTPAVMTRWPLAFVVNPAFIVLGCFVLKRMLRDAGLASGWALLFVGNPGVLYYARTLLGIVPATVMLLLGTSLLFRDRPRAVAGGAALGSAVLFHNWLGPLALVLAVGWIVERARFSFRGLGALALGGLPCARLMIYNWTTTDRRCARHDHRNAAQFHLGHFETCSVL